MKKEYFIGILLPKEVVDFIRETPAFQYIVEKFRGVDPSLGCPRHITLHEPFQFEDESLVLELKNIRSLSTEFRLLLWGLGHFNSSVVYWDVLPVSDRFFKLHESITNSLKVERTPSPWQITPHVSLVKEITTDSFYSVYEYTQRRIVELKPITISVTSFCLFERTVRSDEPWEVAREFVFQS